MHTCPNCHHRLAYPIAQCAGGRCPFCQGKPGNWDAKDREDTRRQVQDENAFKAEVAKAKREKREKMEEEEKANEEHRKKEAAEEWVKQHPFKAIAYYVLDRIFR